MGDVGVRGPRRDEIDEADRSRDDASPRACLGLERRDLARNRGLGERKRLGGGRERAVGGDFAQDAQAADVKHAASLYLTVRNII